jgi:hypothetical protein
MAICKGTKKNTAAIIDIGKHILTIINFNLSILL